MNLFTFSENKHTPSILSKNYAPRKALMAKFDTSARNNYIFVSAPMGSGKSFSSLLWINYAQLTPIWFSLDEYDNILQVFYKQFARALFQQQKSNKNIEKLLSDPDFNSDPVKYIQLIISELYLDNIKYALVFDDIHCIENPKILASLPSILKRLPSNYTVIYISKHAFQEELKNMFYQEKMLISLDDLAFGIEGIQSLFAQKNTAIGKKEAQKLLSMTNGLVIGILLLSKKFEKKESCEDISDDLTEYFEKNLWKNWSNEVREFCLSLALFDDFDLEFAREFSKNPHAQDILNTLLHKNEFVLYKDGLYSFHVLVSKFLRKKVEISGSDSNALYKKACYYYKEKDQYYKALLYAIICSDEKEISSFLWLFFLYEKMRVAGELAFLELLFSKEFEPELYQRSPVFHAIALRYYNIIGEKNKCLYHRSKIVEFLPEIIKENSIAVEYALWCIYLDNTSTISEKLALHKIIRLEHKGTKVVDEILSSEEAEQIRRRLHFTSHRLPFAHRAMLDFSEVAKEPELINKVDESFAKPHWEQWFFWRSLVLSYLALEQLDLEKAKECFKETFKLSLIAECREARFSYLLLEHTFYSYTKEYEKAALVLEKIEEFLKMVPLLSMNFVAYKIRHALITGNISFVKEWLDYSFVKEEIGAKPDLLQVYRRFTTIRVYISMGNYVLAEEEIAIMQNFLEGYNRPLDKGEAKVLLSLIYWYTGREQEAVQELAELIALFFPYNYCKIIVEEGFAILPILKKIVATKKYEESMELYLKRIISLTKAFAKVNIGYIKQNKLESCSRRVRLSKQQYAIISLLAKGYSNAQICDKMKLKITTIKSHTSALYKKLDVNNAADAIKRAKELKLL